jgi:hypothetical protein
MKNTGLALLRFLQWSQASSFFACWPEACVEEVAPSLFESFGSPERATMIKTAKTPRTIQTHGFFDLA